MKDSSTNSDATPDYERQLREMNESLLVSSVRQHELAEQADEAAAALHESQRETTNARDYAEATLRTSPVPLLVLESDLRVVSANEAFYRKFHVDEKQTEGRLVYELGNGQWNMPELRALLEDILPRHELVEHFEVTPEFEHLGTRTMLLNARRMEVESGGRERIVLVIEDVTERKQSEEQLRRSAELLSFLIERSPTGFYIVDSSFCISHINADSQARAFRNVVPAIGRRLDDAMRVLWPEPLATEIINIFHHTLDTGEPYRSPGLVSSRNDLDSVETYEWQLDRITMPDGTYGVVCYYYDTTLLRETELALRQSEERFRMLADNMLQLAWTCDTLGTCTWYNQRWLDYTGLSFDDMQGWGWKQVHHPDHVDRVVKGVEHSRDSGEPWDDTFPLRGNDGQYRWFLSRAVPIRNEAGKIVRWFGTNTDITEQREAQQQAEAANVAKDTFLATLSHELRSPLSAIVGWMHLLRGGTESGCSDEELNEGIAVIDRNAQAMVQLINDVLDVSRIVSGKVRLEVHPCDLSKVIRAGVDVVRPAAQAKDIIIRAELDPAANAVSCDAARVQQVVWNLVSNAVKFTPRGGEVCVRLDRAPSDLRITVSDNGPGIDPELLPYIFDRFRQGDSSSRRYFGGLGLGLSIAKHLVEMHGGTIRADSAGDGQGSTFTVLLPIRAVRIDEDEDGSIDESKRSAAIGLPIVRLDALRVLVVDDDPDARRLLVKVLQQAGAEVTAAASAAEAIEALPTANPHVLVSDLGMPDRDGFDLIRQIRAGGHPAKDLPAVALTAFVRPDDRRKAMMAGFQMHVPKPVDPHDLTLSIASLAGRIGAATG